MNNTKTGQFITELRKQNNLTQSDLANKLGISDKAVSRWETGKGFPDVSLLQPLGEVLGTSVNEIINGEKIEPEKCQQRADQTIVQTIVKSRRYVTNMVTGILASIGAFLLIFSLFLGIDTSWVSISTILGTLVVSLAVFRLFRKRLKTAIISSLLILIIAVGIFETRDYLYVTRYSLPPLFNFKITTTFEEDKKLIKYDKLFYDVVRYNTDTENEFFTIE